MFKFWYEKLIARVIPFFVVVSLIFLIFHAFATVAFVEPADQAPFVKEMVAAHEKKATSKVVPLNKAHRTDNEMKTYLTKVASESLAFRKENFTEVIQNIKPYFTEAGFEKYRKYILSSGIVETVRTKDVHVGAYVETPPLFLNDSVMNKKYKWLYEMPMVVSLVPNDQKTLAEDADQYVNSEFTLRLQVTRVQDEDNAFDGMKVEDWIVVAR